MPSHTWKIEFTRTRRSRAQGPFESEIQIESRDEDPPAAVDDDDDGLVPGQAVGCGQNASWRYTLRAGEEARGGQAGAGGATEAGAGNGGGGSGGPASETASQDQRRQGAGGQPEQDGDGVGVWQATGGGWRPEEAEPGARS